MLLLDKRLIPVSRISQWPERRGFERLYYKNPESQVRLINNLLTMEAFEIGNNNRDDVVSAIELIIRSFTERFSEYLRPFFDTSGHDLGKEVYDANPILLEQISPEKGGLKINPFVLDADIFESFYSNNVLFQTHFIEGLLGFRAVHTEFGPPDGNSPEIISALDIAIVAFTHEFPDYLEKNAYPDQVLVRKLEEIFGTQHAA